MKKIEKVLFAAVLVAGIALVGSICLKGSTTLAAEQTEGVVLKIDGMTCGMCSGKVKVALDKVSGVKECEVSHEKGTAEVKVTKGTDPKTLEDAVKSVGFKVTSVEKSKG